MDYPFCSVIVLNYQGEKFITRTLDSLIKLDYPKDKYEIIVVDNASQDKSREVIENYIDSGSKPGMTKDNVIPTEVGIHIKSIYNPRNLGFAAGNNIGIRKAKGEYVVLLNNDCVVEKEWLKELVKTARKDEKIFAVNSKIMLGSTNKIQNAGIRVFPDGYARDIGAVPKDKKQDYEEDRGQYEVERDIDAACGAAVLYRKSVLDRIGLMDERFFLYYEDVEISERAREQGYRIVYSPKAVVRHEHAASSGEWSPFFIYQTERGRLMHVLLHFPAVRFLAEYGKFTLKSILRLAFGIKHPKRFRQQLQYFRVALFFLYSGLFIKFKGNNS